MITSVRILRVTKLGLCASTGRHAPNPLLINGGAAWCDTPTSVEGFVQKYKEKKRERFLTDEEFHRLGRVLNEIKADSSETHSAVTAIRLLMLTGYAESDRG